MSSEDMRSTKTVLQAALDEMHGQSDEYVLVIAPFLCAYHGAEFRWMLKIDILRHHPTFEYPSSLVLI